MLTFGAYVRADKHTIKSISNSFLLCVCFFKAKNMTPPSKLFGLFVYRCYYIFTPTASSCEAIQSLTGLLNYHC